MKTKAYTRSVTIRDNDMNRWGITFEVREVDPCTKRNIDTLEEFVEHFEVSVCAEGCGSWGQCYGRITPRTPGQKDLLDFWNKYHCGSIASGTRAQEKYLHGEQYKKDFDEFIKIFFILFSMKIFLLCSGSTCYTTTMVFIPKIKQVFLSRCSWCYPAITLTPAAATFSTH